MIAKRRRINRFMRVKESFDLKRRTIGNGHKSNSNNDCSLFLRNSKSPREKSKNLIHKDIVLRRFKKKEIDSHELF